MSGGTNAWQRVDNRGCFPSVIRVFLVSWAVILPYAVMTANVGWFVWSLFCVFLGLWLIWRDRAQRAVIAAEMQVDVRPTELRAGEPFLVSLQIHGTKASTLRWWSAELMADVEGDDPKSVASAEFAIDPDAENAPVSELQMVLAAPSESVIRETESRSWFVQVTVETARGRLESGRVPVRLFF